MLPSSNFYLISALFSWWTCVSSDSSYLFVLRRISRSTITERLFSRAWYSIAWICLAIVPLTCSKNTESLRLLISAIVFFVISALIWFHQCLLASTSFYNSFSFICSVLRCLTISDVLMRPSLKRLFFWVRSKTFYS